MSLGVAGKFSTYIALAARTERPLGRAPRRSDVYKLIMRLRHHIAICVPERHFSRYTVDEASGCWLWAGSKSAGYGTLKAQYKAGGSGPYLAHRAYYEHFVGPISDGLLLKHRCDVRGCVNPDHLEPGTHRENMQEAWDRGRAHRKPAVGGERHPNAKLSDSMARAIAASAVPTSVLAAQMGLSTHSIKSVRGRRGWARVTQDIVCAEGRMHARQLLTKDNAAMIKARLAAGESVRSLAESFGVPRTTVKNIQSGRSWRHL